jgi:hypothetical protein
MTNGQATAAVTAADIERKVAQAVFGKKLITNVFRGHVAEAIVDAALAPEWTWCAADYASCDFERADGMRLEVKQSAVLQSWSPEPPKKITGSFDVAARQGYWEGPAWIAEPGRRAHIYVLAHHQIIDESADHRDPSQWLFYVIRSSELPPVKKISLGPLQRLTTPCRFDELCARVAEAATTAMPS